jgi:hypothetical protein
LVSPVETKEYAKTTGTEGLWSDELEKSDPECNEGGGLIGGVCFPCYLKHMGKPAEPLKSVYLKMLRRIHEEVLLERYGEKFRPYAQYLRKDGEGQVEVRDEEEENQAPVGIVPPEPEEETLSDGTSSED